MRVRLKVLVLHVFVLVEMVYCNIDEYTYLTTEQFIEKFGYPVEVHEVTTEDGYILKVFRIPHGKGGRGINRKPILMMHGLFAQADCYIDNAINNASLAFFMADNGYDVWVGNTRGNLHGMNHVKLSPEDPEFWNYSWHEIGIYDIPAKIDHILRVTKKKKLQYIGHSQGGTIFYIMTSLKPEYQKKIALASLLAPAGYTRHNKLLSMIPTARYHRFTMRFVDLTKFKEVPTRSNAVREYFAARCTNGIIKFRDICVANWHISWGGDSGEFNPDMFPLLVEHVPSVAVKQIVHYVQTVESAHFRPFDYGKARNLEIYGKEYPDDYPVRNIKVPVAMYYSTGDILVVPKDVEDMCDMLANCVRKFLMANEKWTHIDFAIAVHLQKELSEPLLEFAQKYNV
ncbi:hypothetical protein HHI36_019426 [Cryptolaemus montrouzieri]|uniref:Lipase n=1 Tax=Cryptolaemus montrouzieri TaxID=559131 RepID=A0ABD2P3T0_9CUCU